MNLQVDSIGLNETIITKMSLGDVDRTWTDIAESGQILSCILFLLKSDIFKWSEQSWNTHVGSLTHSVSLF